MNENEDDRYPEEIAQDREDERGDARYQEKKDREVTVNAHSSHATLILEVQRQADLNKRFARHVRLFFGERLQRMPGFSALVNESEKLNGR